MAAAAITERGTRAGATVRTFVAIDLPPAIKTDFAARQTALRDHLRHQGVDKSLRWSNPEGLHLTLRFLGETTPAQCADLAAALHGLAAAWSPLTLRLGSLGAFPKQAQPRVLWVGLAGDLTALAAVQTQVEAAVQALGFAPETKPFAPHITLARVRREASRVEVQALGRALASLPEATPAADAASFVVDRLVHYRSDLRPSGAVYTPLAVIPFAAA